MAIILLILTGYKIIAHEPNSHGGSGSVQSENSFRLEIEEKPAALRVGLNENQHNDEGEAGQTDSDNRRNHYRTSQTIMRNCKVNAPGEASGQATGPTPASKKCK